VKIQKTVMTYNTTHKDNKNRVLVHCAMGMSRSATAAIMFLMKLFQAHFDDIFEFVKT
jgi:protein-tyrosine phosphatase